MENTYRWWGEKQIGANWLRLRWSCHLVRGRIMTQPQKTMACEKARGSKGKKSIEDEDRAKRL